MNIFSPIVILIITILVVSCHGIGEGHNLPPERPAGTISGRVVDGAIAGSNINVYSFSNGQPGALLGNTSSDNNGYYEIQLRVPNQPVMLEATGGSYMEETSNTEVTLEGGQFLRSVSYYDSGKIKANITPLSHIVTALTEHKVSTGTNVEQAIEEASEQVSDLFDLDVIQTDPADITDPENATNTLNDKSLYGLYLSALSSFTRWAGEQNSDLPHNKFTSIKLSQLFYSDCKADGVLDGKTRNDKGDPVELGLGIVPVDSNTYRTSLAQHMIAVINSSINKTSLDIDSALPSIQRLAYSEHGLFSGIPPSVSGDTISPLFDIIPEINIEDGVFAFGTIYFSVSIDGPVKASSIEFDIDDIKQNTSSDPSNPILQINVNDYTDGDHWIGVRATDILGVSLYKQFKINFTNISPLATVTSPSITNQDHFPIQGTFDDSGIAIQSIVVQGINATLFDDKSWISDIDLAPGANIITLEITDDIGTVYLTQARIDLDNTAPVIDVSAGHSNALFSLGNGQFEQRALLDSNLDAPLYITSDKTTLNNTLIARGSLDAAGIPFFSFSVSDPKTNNIFSLPAAIKKRIQYKKNQTETPWMELTGTAQDILIPISSETLSKDWHMTTPTDEHFIRVEVTDEAGNKSETMFSFRADIHVPAFTIESITTLNQSLFSSTPFELRSSLHNLEFASTGYTFHNSAPTMYISMLDNSTHSSNQLVDVMIREHDARLKTKTQWRVGLVNSPLSQCPTMGTWQMVDQVLNYTAGGWNPERIPDPVFGDVVSVNSDTPSAPSATSWLDIPDFDNEFAPFGPLPIGSSNWLFNYDYVLQAPDPVNAPIPNPAFITNWTRVDATNGSNVVITCDPVRFFEQREFFSYESVRGPENIASSFNESDIFNTTGFEVMDHGPGVCTTSPPPGSPIAPNSGWFKIPANHCVTINKLVTTPDLTVYNDTTVANPDTFRSYTSKRLDNSLSWRIDQQLMLNAIHDSGEQNISQMSVRSVEETPEEKSTFQISR